MHPHRMPAVFLPHGGGPWPFAEMGFPKAELAALSDYLKSLATLTAVTPRAVVVISAHWEAAVPTVQSHPSPPLLFDYYGFPPTTYQLRWPAPGAPELVERIQSLLREAGMPSARDAERGYDHGTFVPLMLTWPGAEVPVLQVSLVRGLDPAVHLALGRALAPLRDEGILLLGSGMTFHNLRSFGDPRAAAAAAPFEAWLRGAATASPSARDAALAAWAKAPAARQAHPREEHLIPLLVIAGAAGEDVGRMAFSGTMLGTPMSAYHYG